MLQLKGLKKAQRVEAPGLPMLCSVLPDGAWAGRRCFVVGGGPSLRGFDFSRLDGELTIAVNRAYEGFDPTITFFVDERFINWVLKGEFGAEAKRKFLEGAGLKAWYRARTPLEPVPNLYAVKCTEQNAFSWNQEIGLGRVSNGGLGAVHLACCLGATEIYLLGFDMYGDTETQRQAWWHDGYPQVQKESVYGAFLKDFERSAPEIRAHGVRVVNLNPDSALRCFEFGDVDAVLSETEQRPPAAPTYANPALEQPLYATWCTPGYREAAQAWKASAEAFALETFVLDVADAGTWRANTRQKPAALRKIRELHPGRAVVLCDADSLVKRYPEIFDGCALGDVGLYWLEQRELLSGTMYWGPGLEATRLIDAWEALLEKHAKQTCGEQMALDEAFKAMADDLIVTYLPEAYCRIFDNVKQTADAVILHLMHSRKHDVSKR